MSADDALTELRACSGTQFHLAVVDAYLTLTSELKPAHQSMSA